MIAWLHARSLGGRVVMRMEDLDHPKNKKGAAEAALEDLRWLGFDWDEGPDVGGPFAPYAQSGRKGLYRAALEKLRAKGLVYPCACTRRDVEAGQSAPHEGETLLYRGTCRGRFGDFAAARAAMGGRTPAWRFRVEDGATVAFDDLFRGRYEQDVSACCGDFVLARDEFGAGYMLAVVVDDAAMGVTEVVRGDDLLPATPRQLLLYEALGLEPPAFLHVPLVRGPDGLRLAKRHGDTRIAAFREAGVKPERLLGILAATCGWAGDGECVTLRQLAGRFDLAKIPRRDVVWDAARDFPAPG